MITLINNLQSTKLISKNKPIKQIRFVNQYLKLLLFLSFINGPINLIGSALGEREITTYIILYSGLFIDLFLVGVNSKNLRLKPVEQFLIFLLIFSFFYGVVNNPDGGRRYITDSLIPMMLILKVIVFRNYAIGIVNQNKIIRFLKSYSMYLFVSAIITTVLFYILLPYYPMYVGLTPILYPFLTTNIVFFNWINLLIAVILILLSGKRAILVGTLIILFFHKIVFEKKIIKTSLIIAIIFSFFSWAITNNFDYFMQQEAFSKYNWTVELLLSDDFKLNNTDLLDLISGGRMAEIEGSLRGIKWYEYIIGRGSGFTYDLLSNTYGYVKNHSNAHFTPVALITKYGILFYITFMIYIISTLIKARKGLNRNNKYNLIVILITIGTLVDSCFAYVFFIDNFLPIGLGFLQVSIIYNLNTNE